MLYVGFGFVLRNSSIGGAFAIWYIQTVFYVFSVIDFSMIVVV